MATHPVYLGDRKKELRPGGVLQLEEVFLPPRGEGAEILEGSDEEMVEALVERLYREGGLS